MQGSAIIDYIKKAEDSNNIIIRIYEPTGNIAKFSLNECDELKNKKVFETDILENISKKIDKNNIKLKPFELKILKINLT